MKTFKELTAELNEGVMDDLHSALDKVYDKNKDWLSQPKKVDPRLPKTASSESEPSAVHAKYKRLRNVGRASRQIANTVRG